MKGTGAFEVVRGNCSRTVLAPKRFRASPGMRTALLPTLTITFSDHIMDEQHKEAAYG